MSGSLRSCCAPETLGESRGVRFLVRLGCWLSIGGWLAASTTATLAAPPPAPSSSAPARLPREKLPAADGREVDLSEATGRRGLALVFLSIDCPIANGYAPTIGRLADEYEPQGVEFLAVNPNAGQSLKAIAAHGRDYGLTIPLLKDPGGRVAKSLEVAVCPEALLFDAAGTLVYRGRIDDRYQRRGGAAGEVRETEWEDAIRALVAGRKIERPRTEAIGCPVDFGAAPTSRPRDERSADAPASVVFTRDVLPVLQARCQECHRPGGVGPFSLLDYADARRWAVDLRDFTADGRMPPWKAGGEPHQFANERRLTDREKQTIADWVAQGCQEGPAADRPPVREFPAGWRLGEPDLVLEPAEEYPLGADGPDEYRCFVIPTGQSVDRYVTSIEVLPGNPRVVHHVLLFLDDGREAERLDARDPAPGYATTSGFPGFLPSGGLGGWAPGNSYLPLEDGMAKVIPAGSKLVMQVHYHRSGKPERDRTRVGLRWARYDVTRPVSGLPLLPLDGPRGGLRIPAGESHYEVRTRMAMPKDMRAVSITPHMHLLGRTMRVTARRPDGRSIELIDVSDWDFNWQETYRFRRPIDLPRGTLLELTAVYDNSADNPFNPNRPPAEVRWGEQTVDEMCIAFLEVAPSDPIDDPSRLKPPSKEERLQFLLEGKRLAGEGFDWKRLPWSRPLGFGASTPDSQP